MNLMRITSKSHDENLNSLPIVSSNSSKSNISFGHEKFLAALFYAICSILVIFSNKSILTQFAFPYFDFLATIQFLVTTLILSILIVTQRIEVPLISFSICREILPISLMFLGNVICGLGSTRSLNLPMFTALRRFSIFMTMLVEWCFLGAKPSYSVIFSVLMMMGGALLAAVYDLSFDGYGYFLVFLNNLFTALNGVWIRKASMSGKCGKMGVMFYNSLFSAIIMLLFFFGEHYYYSSQSDPSLISSEFMAASISTRSLRSIHSIPTDGNQMNIMDFFHNHTLPSRFLDEKPIDPGYANNFLPNVELLASKAIPIQPISNHQIRSTLAMIYQFEQWNDISFLCMFIIAACMGSVLNYSIFLCTTLNSALTTAVVGALKNVAIAYIGMVFFADYSFSWVNFMGINISIAGSLYYTYITIFKGVSGFGGV